MKLRIIAFVTVCALCVTVAAAYSLTAANRTARPPSTNAEDAADGTAQVSGPYLGFIGTRIDATGGRLAVTPAGQPVDEPNLTGLRCKVAHAAAGRGICLETGSITANVIVFDERFRPIHSIPFRGLPSRARVAPDGTLGAVTVFVSGHSYAVAGFSTSTEIIDLTSGQTLASLEEFNVVRDGKPFSSPDFNYWGVTFSPTDRGRFYATLGTGGETYLVEGDLATRTARVLRSNVECPSLSPDGTRIVFKKRVSGGLGPVRWRLHVLDLATLREIPLGEKRSIDDQAEWLDDQRVAYSTMRPAPSGESDTWAVTADATGTPAILVADARSPVAVRQWPQRAVTERD